MTKLGKFFASLLYERDLLKELRGGPFSGEMNYGGGRGFEGPSGEGNFSAIDQIWID